MSERFERHRQPWKQDELQKLHQLAHKGMSVRAIAKALTRSEESVQIPRQGGQAQDQQAQVAFGRRIVRSTALSQPAMRARR